MKQTNTKKYYWIGALLLLIVIGGIVTATTYISDDKINSGGNIYIPNNSSLVIHAHNSSGVDEDNPQSIYMIADDAYSKAFIIWQDNSSGSLVNQGWFGCHNMSTVGGGTAHQHCAWESYDSDVGYLVSKFTMSHNTLRENAYMWMGNIANFTVDVDDTMSVTGKIDAAQSIYGHASYYLDRATTGTEAFLRFTTADVQKWSIGMDDDTTDDKFKIRNGAGKDAITIKYTNEAEVSIYNLSGSGNAFVCVNGTGFLYRSGSACV